MCGMIDSSGPTSVTGRKPWGGAWGWLSAWLVATPWVVYALVTINLVSAVAGYIYWYGGDILAAPLWQWPFVPDSPLSATLWAFAFLAYHRGRRWHLLGLLATTGAIKYGLWTDFIWYTNSLSSHAYTLEAWAMSLNHFAMVLEGLLLLPLVRLRMRDAFIVAGWYGLNDLLDYGIGPHPRVPNPWDYTAITIFAVGTTVVLTAVWFILALVRSRRARTMSASSGA
jgi:Predicted membrane protein